MLVHWTLDFWPRPLKQNMKFVLIIRWLLFQSRNSDFHMPRIDKFRTSPNNPNNGNRASLGRTGIKYCPDSLTERRNTVTFQMSQNRISITTK